VYSGGLATCANHSKARSWAIFEAIRSRNAELAERLAREHVARVKERFIKSTFGE